MSPAHITERNRANAQHSTGPKTPEGKAASSKNSTTHGLSGKLTLKSQAEAQRYQQRIAELTRFYKLTNPMASSIIQHLVTAEVRMAQAFAAEQAVLTQLKLKLLEELDHQPTEDELEALVRIRDAETTRLLPQLNRHYVAADRSWRNYYKALNELKAVEDAAARERELASHPVRSIFDWDREPVQNEPTAAPDTAAPAPSDAAATGAA